MGVMRREGADTRRQSGIKPTRAKRHGENPKRVTPEQTIADKAVFGHFRTRTSLTVAENHRRRITPESHFSERVHVHKSPPESLSQFSFTGHQAQSIQAHFEPFFLSVHNGGGTEETETAPMVQAQVVRFGDEAKPQDPVRVCVQDEVDIILEESGGQPPTAERRSDHDGMDAQRFPLGVVVGHGVVLQGRASAERAVDERQELSRARVKKTVEKVTGVCLTVVHACQGRCFVLWEGPMRGG